MKNLCDKAEIILSVYGHVNDHLLNNIHIVFYEINDWYSLTIIFLIVTVSDRFSLLDMKILNKNNY